MYKVRDNALSNRIVPFADGLSVVFVDHVAYVPDAKIDYFRRISDFQVQTHVDEAEVLADPVAAQEKLDAPEAVSEKPIDEKEEPKTMVEEEKSKQEAKQPEVVEKKEFTKVTK